MARTKNRRRSKARRGTSTKDYDKIALTAIRSKLRQIWLWYSSDRKLALETSKRRDIKGKLLGAECAHCKGIFKIKDVQVDHVKKLGKLTWGDLGNWTIALMFGDQVVLCKPCHLIKTLKERKDVQ